MRNATVLLAACLMASGAANVRAAAPSLGMPTQPVRIIATDRGFEAPVRISSGLRHIVFENHGKNMHEAMLIKLPRGMSGDDYVAAVKAGSDFPPGAIDYSGAGLTAPGERVELWTRLDPGEYLIMCWNGDHASRLPQRTTTVVDDDRPEDRAPKEDAVLELIDYRFEMHGELRAGERVIRIETPGPSMHEIDIFRMLPGRTRAELNRWLKQEDASLPYAGPVPAVALGGMGDRHDIHGVGWLRRRFEPGHYVFSCEMAMPGGAPGAERVSHADAGMVKEFEIRP